MESFSAKGAAKTEPTSGRAAMMIEVKRILTIVDVVAIEHKYLEE